MSAALVVKVRGSATPVITDTVDVSPTDARANVDDELRDPDGVLSTVAHGVLLLFPVRSIESIGILDGSTAAEWRAAQR